MLRRLRPAHTKLLDAARGQDAGSTDAKRGRTAGSPRANCGRDAGSLDGGRGSPRAPAGRRSVKLFLGSTVNLQILEIQNNGNSDDKI